MLKSFRYLEAEEKKLIKILQEKKRLMLRKKRSPKKYKRRVDIPYTVDYILKQNGK